MDRKTARKNIRFGLSLFIMLFALLAATFVWATVYLQVIK